MPGEDRLAVCIGEFFRDPVPPSPVLGAVFVRHLGGPHLVPGAQRVLQARRQFMVRLVRAFPAAVDEEHAPLRGTTHLLRIPARRARTPPSRRPGTGSAAGPAPPWGRWAARTPMRSVSSRRFSSFGLVGYPDDRDSPGLRHGRATQSSIAA